MGLTPGALRGAARALLGSQDPASHYYRKKEMLVEIAKWIVALIAVFNLGGYVADAVVPFTAKQHLYNPRWPPHAKFHNCQTMLMGIGLGVLSLSILFGARPLTLPLFYLATAIAGLYFVAMLFVPIFPGTAWQDPEFVQETPLPLGLHPQKLVALIVCALLFLACILAYTNSR